jgi:uncharacterized protein
MSLTNYLLQSVIGVFIFKGFIDLYGKLSLFALEVVAWITFSLMLLGSWLWLRKFRYGPMEWIWRKLSYGRKINIAIVKNDIIKINTL